MSPRTCPKALEVAERAILLKNPPLEVWFNRALALEKLHLVDVARKAWDDYLERDAASGWADEARQHRDALPTGRRSSVEEDEARVKAALEGGQAAVDRLADEAPSLLRDHLDDVVLPAWAEAQLVGHPDAQAHRDHARLLGEALFRATGDRPAERHRPRPLRAVHPTSQDALRSQALGHRAVHEGKRLHQLQQPACAQFRAAQGELEAGGSPYEAWARQQIVTTCLLSSSQDAARAALDALGHPRGLGLLSCC